MDLLEFASEMLRDQCDWLREKRLHPRVDSNRGVIVLMLGTKPRLAGATVLDWSTMGMKIQHSLPLKPRQKVRVIASERQWTCTLLGSRIAECPVSPGFEEEL
jgi:hypothetical protein